MSEKNSPPQAASHYPRLPCRGCTAECKNHAVCEGTPWRINREGRVPAGQAESSRN